MAWVQGVLGSSRKADISEWVLMFGARAYLLVVAMSAMLTSCALWDRTYPIVVSGQQNVTCRELRFPVPWPPPASLQTQDGLVYWSALGRSFVFRDPGRRGELLVSFGNVFDQDISPTVYVLGATDQGLIWRKAETAEWGRARPQEGYKLDPKGVVLLDQLNSQARTAPYGSHDLRYQGSTVWPARKSPSSRRIALVSSTGTWQGAKLGPGASLFTSGRGTIYYDLYNVSDGRPLASLEARYVDPGSGHRVRSGFWVEDTWWVMQSDPQGEHAMLCYVPLK